MLKIEIKTGGAAFTNEDGEFDAYYGGEEIKRIVKEVVEDIQNGYVEGYSMDINGNKVCTWTLEN
jgi:hypothetical protein